MPLYVYEPDARPDGEPAPPCCTFEFLQSLSEPALTACPECGGAVHRALTSFGFSVRGSSQGTQSSNSAPPLFKSSSASGDAAAAQGSSAGADTRAGRVARLAANHVCGVGCRH